MVNKTNWVSDLGKKVILCREREIKTSKPASENTTVALSSVAQLVDYSPVH